MALKFESFVAFRYLRSRRKEVFISFFTIISILGVGISVMVLDISLAIMTGFKGELRAKLVGAGEHIRITRYGESFSDWPDIRKKVLEIPGVKAAFPYTLAPAMLSSASGAKGLIVRGIADDPGAREKMLNYVKPGLRIDKLFTPAEVEITRPDGITDTIKLFPLIVGNQLARQLGFLPNAPVTLISPNFSSSPHGFIAKQRRFAVVDVYRSGLVEYESRVSYTSLEAAQAFFGFGSSVSGIEIVVNDLAQTKEITETVVDRLASEQALYYVTNWMQANKPLWEALELETRVYFVVLLLLTLVASFSIISTLVMVVMEKGKEIAILKSMGASNNVISKIFLIQGAFIALIGSIVGSGLGVLGCLILREWGFELDWTVFSLDQVPVYMEPLNFVLVAVAAFFIATLAGVYPARRAAKLIPAEVLRFD